MNDKELCIQILEMRCPWRDWCWAINEYRQSEDLCGTRARNRVCLPGLRSGLTWLWQTPEAMEAPGYLAIQNAPGNRLNAKHTV